MTGIRWKLRLENLEKAQAHLAELSRKDSLNWVEETALIKLFEIVFELSWKTLKDYLYTQGIVTKSPRETIKQAYRLALIEQGDVWLDALEKRNTATHRYDEAYSHLLSSLIQERYAALFEQLLKTLNNLNNDE